LVIKKRKEEGGTRENAIKISTAGSAIAGETWEGEETAEDSKKKKKKKGTGRDLDFK